MTRLVLHIGLHKTGTTAFQSFISRNRDQLAQHGIGYPAKMRRSNHGELAVAFTPRITPLTRSYDVNDEKDRRRLRAELPAVFGDLGRAPTWIASSEHLSSLLRRQQDVDALAEFLRGLFDHVTVVVTIRRADYWLPSMYVESVKSGSVRPLDTSFVSRHGDLVDHATLLGRWAASFGRDNIRVVPFLETDKANALAVPGRLLVMAGAPADLVSTLPMPPQVTNTSLSAYGTEVLRAMNQARPDRPMKRVLERPRVVRVIRRQWPGPPMRLTPDAAEFAYENGWVRTDLTALGYQVDDDWQHWLDHPDADVAPLPEVDNDDVQRLIRILRRKGVLDASPRAPRSLFRRAAGRARRKLRRRST